jgi:hypothetical protein
MKKSRWLLALGLAASLLPTAPASAADHRDGSTVLEDPATDINDLYSWVSTDGASVYLAMTVLPFNAAGAKFSNAAYYVFHTNNRPAAGGAGTNVDIICGFDAAQKISCWFGSTDFVSGDASVDTAPLTTASGIQVFAGQRTDHFFFNLNGFNQARKDVKAGVTGVVAILNANNCPTSAMAGNAGAATMKTALTDLSKDTGGAAAAADQFLNQKTLAIVVKVPVAMLNASGPILAVWAGTHRKG